MPCTYEKIKPTAHASQTKREVLFCSCSDCKDAREMNQGLRLSLRKSVKERLLALQWQAPEPPAPEALSADDEWQ